MTLKALISICLVIFLFSCREDPPFNEPNFGYDFFPIQEGAYVIYEIDSIVYNDFTRDTDKYHYFLKEEIGKPLNQTETELHFELLRYTRGSNSEEWVLQERFSIARDRYEGHRTERNKKYTQLIFPVNEGQRWDGNQYNDFKERSYEISAINDISDYNGIPTSSILEVSQDSNINLIERDVAHDKYAKGIGLVYRFREYIFTRTDGINLENDVDSGLSYTMDLVDFHRPS